MNNSLTKMLKNFDVHLASGSPRRKLILQQIVSIFFLLSLTLVSESGLRMSR